MLLGGRSPPNSPNAQISPHTSQKPCRQTNGARIVICNRDMAARPNVISQTGRGEAPELSVMIRLASSFFPLDDKGGADPAAHKFDARMPNFKSVFRIKGNLGDGDA
jgi:hypothetical protein